MSLPVVQLRQPEYSGKTRVKPRGVYLELCGEFDFFSRERLRSALETHAQSGSITLDFAKTTFIDASVLGVLIALALFREDLAQARIRIVNTSLHVRKLFRVCGLEQSFQFAEEPGPNGSPY